jgi:hypothetical protein
MPTPLAQFADLDRWVQVVIIGLAASPLMLLAVFILYGLVGWIRDPKSMWTRRK